MAGQNRSNTAKMANLVLRKTVERFGRLEVAGRKRPEKPRPERQGLGPGPKKEQIGIS
jgi:hypothetical protein